MSETTIEYNQEELLNIANALQSGFTIAQITGITSETLEGLYAIAYQYYTVEDYENAQILFQALCTYKHNEQKFWLGLAGSRQALQDYKGAIDAYSMAGITSSLQNPLPFFYAAQCFIKMEDKENAIISLKALLTMGEATNKEHAFCKEKAKEILSLLEQHNT